MILDATTKSIELLLGEATATTECDVTAGWGDYTASSFTPGSADTVSNGTTAVAVVAAPAASTQRLAMEITVHNADTVPHTVVLRLVSGANHRVFRRAVVEAGGDLSYVPAALPTLKVG